MTRTHLLEQLRLPSRYESLVEAVGKDVAQLLVEPDDSTMSIFREAALHIRARGRGLFLPLFARSGTGKTTLVTSLVAWLPREFTPTARIGGGEVTADRLRQAAEALTQEHRLPANEGRVIVLNIDDRESDPPTDKELSQIKGFVRESGVGSRSLVVWPETSQNTAEDMSRSYEERAGESPFTIPAVVQGPPLESWQGLAVETLKLVNGLSSLEELGVDPRTYNPDKFKTLGDFLDRVSADFVGLLHKLINETRKPLRLVITFVSESGKAGVLGELAGGSRYGFLDAQRLLSATPQSVIGKWWSARAGLLVQTIVRLDARIVFITPSLAVPIIRRYGPSEAVEILEKLEVKSRPPSDISTYFERSEFGRLLLGTDSPTAEIRGNPAHDAAAALGFIASDYGYGSGNDKRLNAAVGDFLSAAHADLGASVVEKKLAALPLIPDLAIDSENEAVCIELHWRSGDFLLTANRSEIAQYALKKLKSYATESGWASA